MRRGIAILRDRYRYLNFIELLALLRDACFRNEIVLIYGALLQKPGVGDPHEHQRFPVVKGDLARLERARAGSERVPWEFQCDLYDGVKDYFAYFDAETGAIGHISWLYYYQDPNRTLRLGDQECEIMFCLTLPDYRGRGLYPAALREIQRYLKERGFERCFICATKDNLPSIHGIEKSGFRLAGTTRFLKLFGLQISRRLDTRRLDVA